MISPQSIRSASERISPYILHTPVEFSRPLEDELGVSVYLKQENLQVSGSFKPRGGFNKILKNRGAEFVAPTAGGHGVGLSYAAWRLNETVHILMPRSADPERVADIRANGATVQLFDSVPEARVRARELESHAGYVFVSAYSDVEMIEGGGTIAVELLDDVPNIDCLVCGVGGAGYIAGMAVMMKSINPDLKIFGVQQQNGALLAAWHRDGHYPSDFSINPSIAEGVGAAVEEESLTWPYVRELVDDFFIVTEAEIRDALIWLLKTHKHYVEPSAVVGLAAIRKYPGYFRQFNAIATVLTGRNMSYAKFTALTSDSFPD